MTDRKRERNIEEERKKGEKERVGVPPNPDRPIFKKVDQIGY